MKSWTRPLVSFFLGCSAILLVVFSFPTELPAQDERPAHSAIPKNDCSTPRRAAQSFVYWTRAQTFNPERAVQCFDKSGRSPGKLRELARELRAIYDSRALSIDVNSLPDESGWTDPGSGEARIALHSHLPDLVLERTGAGQWKFSRETLNRADFLATQAPLISRTWVEGLPDALRADLLGVEVWQALALLLVLVVGLVVRKVIQFVLVRRLAPLASRFGTKAVKHSVAVFAGPGSTLAMAGMLAAFYPQLGLPFFAARALGVFVRALVIFSLVLALYRVVDVLADRMGVKAQETDSKLDDQLVPLVRKALKIVVVCSGVLFLLQNLDVNVASLLAGLGIGGVAVALAAKDTIANFFGSVMIFIDRPFQIGDWVKINDVEGIVEEVGFRSTRVRTFYNSLVTVPNAHFTEAAIDNLGLREYRRTSTTLNLTYDTTPEQMQAFIEGIRAIIVANPFTRKDYYEIHFAGFGAHSLDVMVYLFFKVDSWTAELRERHNVYMEILRLAHHLGVEFAFPTQTLHLDKVAAPGAERLVPEPMPQQRMAEVIRSFGPRGQESRPAAPALTHGFLAGATPRGAGEDG